MKKGVALRKWTIPDKAYYWLLVLPGIIVTFMFNTRTWPGVLAAFEDFIPTLGWYKSEWIGWDNFEIFFRQPDAWRIIRNTITMAVGKIILGSLWRLPLR